MLQNVEGELTREAEMSDNFGGRWGIILRPDNLDG